MNLDITKVTIVFENCETVTVDRDNILWMHVGDITQKSYRYANALHINDVLGQFGIALHKDTPCDFFGSVSLATRLGERDVTHVVFIDKDDNEHSYVVEWGDYNRYDQYSINQRVQHTPQGHTVFVSTTSSIIQVNTDEIDTFASYM